MIKIFITHYTKLTDRKEFLLNQLSCAGITDFEFITEYDQEDLPENILHMFQGLNLAEISIFMKHIKCYQKIEKDKIHSHFLILEDDVILANNFVETLSNYLKQLPADFDTLFIGDGFNYHVEPSQIVPDKNIYKVPYYSRCLDSYFISKRYANCVIESFSLYIRMQIKMPIDHWFNSIGDQNKCKSYWAEPTIITQGSQTGKFVSSIRDY